MEAAQRACRAVLVTPPLCLAVAGVYAQTVFVEALGAKPESLRNCTPLPVRTALLTCTVPHPRSLLTPWGCGHRTLAGCTPTPTSPTPRTSCASWVRSPCRRGRGGCRSHVHPVLYTPGLTRDGSIRKDVDPASVPVFGAAADGASPQHTALSLLWLTPISRYQATRTGPWCWESSSSSPPRTRSPSLRPTRPAFPSSGTG